ncbi:MAG: DUF3592 domain-containing protein [Acidobacteria bacterium]|nr:DUF3592 domain-containing protein [Acidobacteriota bacterium]
MHGWNVKVFAAALIVIFFGVPGLLLIGAGVRQTWRGFAAASWPSVDATVQLSANRAPDPRAFPREVEFAYEVDKFPYRSERLRYGVTVSDLANWEIAMLQLRHPIGSKVKLHYDAEDPAIAVLEPGIGSGVVLLVGIGLVLVVIAVGTCLLVLDNRLSAGMQGPLLMFVTVFCCIGIALLIPGGRILWRGWSSQKWTAVEGHIVPHQTPTTKEPQLIYQFVVDGKTYFGVRRAFPPPDSSHDTWETDISYHFKAGQTVTVHYHPGNPWDAVLEPGIRDEDWFLAAGGGAFLLFGLFAGLAGSGLSRRK